MTGFTNELYIEFQENLRIWILQYINYTREGEKLSFLQRQGAVTLIPKGKQNKRELGNWRPITLLKTLYKIISSILAKKIFFYY